MPMRVFDTTKPMSSVTRMQVMNVPIWWLDTNVRATLNPPLSPNGDAGLIWIGGGVLFAHPHPDRDTRKDKKIDKTPRPRARLRVYNPQQGADCAATHT